jgi:hypothetical protein
MNLSDVREKKILISCLNWGMGHVSRCIGLIQKLEKQGNTCVVAGNEAQLAVFKTYFPLIETINHEGYPFNFSNEISFFQTLWKQKNRILQFIRTEKKVVQNIVIENKIELVISDHRYGFETKACPCIFLTHQLNPKLKGLSKLFIFFHNYWMNQFDFKWIVDNPSINLAGDLSKSSKRKRTYYIGLLSRFENEPNILNLKKQNALLLLSGPGVHHDFLFKSFISNCPENQQKIILGSPKAINSLQVENQTVEKIGTNDWKVIDNYLLESADVYSFSGYTTLMDLYFLKCQKHLFPCPNQWEQIYLSEIHEDIS